MKTFRYHINYGIYWRILRIWQNLWHWMSMILRSGFPLVGNWFHFIRPCVYCLGRSPQWNTTHWTEIKQPSHPFSYCIQYSNTEMETQRLKEQRRSVLLHFLPPRSYLDALLMENLLMILKWKPLQWLRNTSKSLLKKGLLCHPQMRVTFKQPYYCDVADCKSHIHKQRPYTSIPSWLTWRG